MRQLLKKFVLSLCLFLIACSGTSGVGVIVNKPRPPELNLFPDMDAYIPTTALGVGESSTSNLTRQVLFTSEEVSLEDLFNGVFRERGMVEKDIIRNQLEAAGEIIATATAAAGITELDETLQTFSLGESVQLIEMTAAFDVSARSDPNDDEYARYYFTNPDTETIQATYIVKSDSDGQPVIGAFAYVRSDPTVADSGPDDDMRFLLFVYDVTDATQTQFMIQEDRYSPSLETHFVEFVHAQCNQGETSTDCMGEVLEIVTEAPTRTFSQFSSRFSWNESSQVICIAQTDYSSGSLVLGTSSQLTGPDFDSSTVTENTCSVATTYDADSTPFPLWGDHIFTADDLIERYEDTNPEGGTVMEYYGDGTSVDSWNTLTPALIETLLRPE